MREELPHAEIQFELNQAYQRGFKEIGKGIIAKHALLSFFPQQIRNNDLLQLYIYKKLFKGTSPLTTRSVNALSAYYTSIEPILREKILKHSELAAAMLNAMTMLLPDDKVDFYFDNYLKLINLWKDSILENDYVFLNAIIDDFWITQNWNYNSEEIFMLNTVSKAFNSKTLPFSVDYFQEYVQSNRESLIQQFGNCAWISNDTDLVRLWNHFSTQGINFTYLVNPSIFGLLLVYFIAQLPFETDVNLFRYALEYVDNIYFIFENRSQNSVLLFGLMGVPIQNLDNVERFFSRLKDLGAIQDYLLFSGREISENFYYQCPTRKTITESNSKKLGQIGKYDGIFHKIDFLDNIFLHYLRMIGFLGYPLDDISTFVSKIRSQIESQISELEKKIENIKEIKDIKTKSSNILHIILPSYFIDAQFINIGDYIQNTHLNNIENHFFFTKWHFILSHIQKFQNVQHFSKIIHLKQLNPSLYVTIQNEIHLLKKFVVSYYKTKRHISQIPSPYNVEDLIEKLIHPSESGVFLSDAAFILSRLLVYYEKAIKPHNFQFHVLTEQINYLKDVMNYSEKKILDQFLKRLKKYISSDIITPILMRSVVFEKSGYLDCILFPKTIPPPTRMQISINFRKNQFNILDNLLNEWDLDFGEINPLLRKTQWKFSYKAKLPTITFIPLPYDVLYFHERLYDFSEMKFVSLNPKFEEVLAFCSTHLKNNHSTKSSIFTEYLDTKKVTDTIRNVKLVNNSKHIDDLIPSYTPDQIFSISQLFRKAIEKDTSVFVNQNETSLKIVDIEVNWPKIGLEEYIVSYTVKKEEIFHKSLPYPVNTREFLLIPGLKEIYGSSNTGYSERVFQHYIFPFNSPPYSLYNIIESWNYIEDLQIIRIKSKQIWFNSHLLEKKTSQLHTWSLVAYRIITGTMKNDIEIPISYVYQPGQNIMGKNSNEYQTIQTIYGKNIRQLKNLPLYKVVQKLFFGNFIWYIPNLDKVFKLPLRVIIQLFPLTTEQMRSISSLFITVPQSIVYHVEFITKKTMEPGIFADLRFYICDLSEFFDTIKKIVDYFQIKNCLVIPSIIPITKEDYLGKSIKNYPDLFESFIWDKNRFKNIKFLTQYGPLDYSARYKQLR